MVGSIGSEGGITTAAYAPELANTTNEMLVAGGLGGLVAGSLAALHALRRKTDSLDYAEGLLEHDIPTTTPLANGVFEILSTNTFYKNFPHQKHLAWYPNLNEKGVPVPHNVALLFGELSKAAIANRCSTIVINKNILQDTTYSGVVRELPLHKYVQNELGIAWKPSRKEVHICLVETRHWPF